MRHVRLPNTDDQLVFVFEKQVNIIKESRGI
jgi:hypothetical protein